MDQQQNILQIENLSKYFGGLAAVSDCSLKIKKVSPCDGYTFLLNNFYIVTDICFKLFRKKLHEKFTYNPGYHHAAKRILEQSGLYTDESIRC